MSFQQALSGLNASSKSLDVIGNNIANANTVGSKTSRAEFGAMVAGSTTGGSGASAGLGVEVSSITQEFTQGNLSITGNNLDIAINGLGFFQVQLENGSNAYSRNGQFKLDKSGYVVSNSGAKVMGLATDVAGVKTSATPSPLMLPNAMPIPAQATTLVNASFNLNSAESLNWNSATNTPPLNKYGTSLNVYDSQGNPVPLKLAFVKKGVDEWEVRNANLAAGALPSTAALITTLRFKADGSLDAATPYVPATLTIPAVVPTGTTPDAQINREIRDLKIDFSKVTQYATAFAVSNLTQNGYTSGSLTGVSINEQGLIKTNYSNGQTQFNGMISLANFKNPQGLEPVGGNNWKESFASGQPTTGQPGTGQFGTTRSGALEDSNVDLTAELVDMMTTQRAYQANAQTIKTQDQVMQTLINMR
jgi:flagellar hook protein FlgE